jgi:hypothetical protein
LQPLEWNKNLKDIHVLEGLLPICGKRGEISFFFGLTNNGTKNFDPSACLMMQNKIIIIFIPHIPSLLLL